MKMTPEAVILGKPADSGGDCFRGRLSCRTPTGMTPLRRFFGTHGSGSRRTQLYIANGCVYCHSQSIRTIDWGLGAERIAQAGDYVPGSAHPAGVRSEPGPDLSQEGGEHPDDWHIAHFTNPRYTRPYSIMPAFGFSAENEINDADPLCSESGVQRGRSAHGTAAFSGKRKPSGL